MDGWICDTKSDDSVRKGVKYVRFPEIPVMEECRESVCDVSLCRE